MQRQISFTGAEPQVLAVGTESLPVQNPVNSKVFPGFCLLFLYLGYLFPNLQTGSTFYISFHTVAREGETKVLVAFVFLNEEIFRPSRKADIPGWKLWWPLYLLVSSGLGAISLKLASVLNFL